MSVKQKIRCAVYTRKSTEEGLDQEFNSLDAQYEASVAYIQSQKHEGWKLVNDRYDDGGISGGTLERPAVQRLLADIDAGRIDMVVVYKIDRLTRSLADFAKMVERFEKSDCSFVSVTQAFNTSSSMGRLTLNVLLSFAQFEREVTAERIRDKIAASKAKGMWMGGRLPIGYDKDPDPNARRLVINPTEANTVRRLFALYDELGCLHLTKQQAEKEGLRSKLMTFANGRACGDNPFSRGQLYHLLRNPTYLGRIPHKQISYVGLHHPIIEQELWDRVQQKLQLNAARPRRKSGDNPKSQTEPSPLTGKLFDESGDRLTPSHAVKSGKRHRYYVSSRLVTAPKDETDRSGWRLPAKQIEKQITSIVSDHLSKLVQNHRLLATPDAAQLTKLTESATKLIELKAEKGTEIAATLVERCTISPGQIETTFNQKSLAAFFEIEESLIDEDTFKLTSPFQLRRRGVETKIVSGTTRAEPDQQLIAILAKAHGWLEEIRSGKPMHQISAEENHGEDYVRARIELAFLSPKIQQQILEGSQPPELTLRRLVKGNIPIAWTEQEMLFA